MISTEEKSTTNIPKLLKGNIPINEIILNKYKNVNDIFNNERLDYKNIITIKESNIKIQSKKATELYHIAVNIFHKNHIKNVFNNDGNMIHVTNSDIKESINKIYNDRLQKTYINEHLKIFSHLGTIIKNAKLVNQTIENKNRTKYITWNYYYNGLKIDNYIYSFEFSRNDGENHYRLQRLQKANPQSALSIKDKADLGESAFMSK